MARAAGAERMAGLKRVHYMWHHIESGSRHGYDWRVADQEFSIVYGANRIASMSDREEPDNRAEKELYGRFQNDRYWLMIELFMLQDGSVIREFGETAIPGFDRTARALELSYRNGDRYVLYVGDNDLTVAWAIYGEGEKEPKLVTTRGARRAVSGLNLPTEFRTADGELYARFRDLLVQ
ncbi:MAG: hypothetical protein ACYTGN_00030 [Planctomycetota bacterium]